MLARRGRVQLAAAVGRVWSALSRLRWRVLLVLLLVLVILILLAWGHGLWKVGLGQLGGIVLPLLPVHIVSARDELTRVSEGVGRKERGGGESLRRTPRVGPHRFHRYMGVSVFIKVRRRHRPSIRDILTRGAVEEGRGKNQDTGETEEQEQEEQASRGQEILPPPSSGSPQLRSMVRMPCPGVVPLSHHAFALGYIEAAG